MSDIEDTEYNIEGAIENLTDVLQKPRIKDFARALMSPIGDDDGLLQVFKDLLENRALSNAEGIQLDRLAEILGIIRTGETDEEFVIKIIGGASAILGNASRDFVVERTRKILDDDKLVLIYDWLQASFGVFTESLKASDLLENSLSADPVPLIEILTLIAAPGVGYITLVFGDNSPTLDYFGWNEDFPHEGEYSFVLDDDEPLQLSDLSIFAVIVMDGVDTSGGVIQTGPLFFQGFGELEVVLFNLENDDELELEVDYGSGVELHDLVVSTGDILNGGKMCEGATDRPQ